MCKYCIFTMDWTSRISYVYIGQYYYYYCYYAYISVDVQRIILNASCMMISSGRTEQPDC